MERERERETHIYHHHHHLHRDYMPVISISLSIDFLWEIEESIKEWQSMNPNAKVTRNMVVRHYIQRGIEYTQLLDKAKETGGVIKIVEL